ncbi:uncharacterized protein G2W53_039879 [Senna tora]|uniref:Uncharacterized protein n=1 Tax=Senna tora TaxID=362788 RepID=A0A834SRA5_9FABA|nr:uncharacterized protein G2W53_039879 [Senna tora]
MAPSLLLSLKAPSSNGKEESCLL